MSLGQDWWSVQSEEGRSFWRQSPYSGHKAYGVTSAPTFPSPSATVISPNTGNSDTETGVTVSGQWKNGKTDTETGVAVSGYAKNGYSDTEMGVTVSGHCEKGKTDTGRRVLVSMVPFK